MAPGSHRVSREDPSHGVVCTGGAPVPPHIRGVPEDPISPIGLVRMSHGSVRGCMVPDLGPQMAPELTKRERDCGDTGNLSATSHLTSMSPPRVTYAQSSKDRHDRIHTN